MLAYCFSSTHLRIRDRNVKGYKYIGIADEIIDLRNFLNDQSNYWE